MYTLVNKKWKKAVAQLAVSQRTIYGMKNK